jgi:TonB family protein
LTKWADLQWQGWLASVALHAAIATLVLIAPVNKVIDATTPFHWDVRLVENNIPVAQTVEAGAGGEVSPRKRSHGLQDKSMPQAIAKQVNRPSTHRQKPVETAQPVHRQIQDRRVVNREDSSLQEVTRSENPHIIKTVPQAVIMERLSSQPSTRASSESTAVIDRSEKRQEYEAKTSEIRDKAESRPRLSATVSAETAAVVRSGAVQHQDAITRPDVVQEASVEMRSSPIPKSAVSSLPGGEGGDGPDEATGAMQLGAKEGGVAEIIKAARSKPTASEMESVGSRGTHRDPTAAASVSGSGKGTGPDYGWLKRLLWERINRIKSYSEDAVEKEWEGRVVMVVTIRSDGGIEEVNVVESSGNGSLDREAAALIARVTPLELDRVLGAERVKLRVPISFGLE